MGNDKIHSIVAEGNHELMVWLQPNSGSKEWAHYEVFYVAGEDDQYRLTVTGYNGSFSKMIDQANLIDMPNLLGCVPLLM